MDFEDEPIPPESTKGPTHSSANSIPASRPTRLTRFLNDLALRPNDPPHDLEEPNLQNDLHRSSAFASGPSVSSIANLSAPSASLQRNPEADSFAYMETLLESLAVLGKLGAALDAVAQRLPAEIYALVESTLEEVTERTEYGRRGSILMGVTAGTSGVLVLAHGGSSMVKMPGVTSPLSASQLRLASLESSSKQADHETLKDFFWTLYSKFDAVLQGLRVIYEVANRIGSVSLDLDFLHNLVLSVKCVRPLNAPVTYILTLQRHDFKDLSGAKAGTLFPLADVWMPIQAEVIFYKDIDVPTPHLLCRSEHCSTTT